MDVDWNAEVVDQLESHWEHQLRPRLEGLTDDEYLWEPSDGVPTIAWRLAHITSGLAETNGTHFGGPPVDARTFHQPAGADLALAQLDDQHAQWVDGVRRLGSSGLALPQGPSSPPEFADQPMARLILYTHVEVIHHGAEICLLRDLYASQG